MTTPQMKEPIPGGCNVGCNSCAFREASVTRSEPYNMVKSTLCDLGGIPFYCHYDKNGHNFYADTEKPETSQMRICQGWAAQMRIRAKDPEWRERRTFRKVLAEMALGALEMLVDNRGDRTDHLKTIRTGIEMLVLNKRKKTNPMMKDNRESI